MSNDAPKRLTDQQIGEFTECTHGPDGGRLFGCIDCALQWHNRQADEASATMANHEAWIAALKRERQLRSAS